MIQMSLIRKKGLGWMCILGAYDWHVIVYSYLHLLGSLFTPCQCAVDCVMHCLNCCIVLHCLLHCLQCLGYWPDWLDRVTAHMELFMLLARTSCASLYTTNTRLRTAQRGGWSSLKWLSLAFAYQLLLDASNLMCATILVTSWLLKVK